MIQSHGFKGEKCYSARGRFFLYQSSNSAISGADERIAVEANGQPLGDFYVGDSIELPMETDSWRIAPYAAGLTGQVMIGDGRVKTNRIAGAVQIIDTGHLSTMAGLQFSGAPTSNALVSNIRVIGLKATGPNLSIRRLSISSPAAGDVQIVFAQGDPIPTWVDNGGLPNKRASLGTIAQMKVQKFSAVGANLASGVDYPTVTGVATHYVAANTPSEFPLSRPIVLESGWSLAVSVKDLQRGLTVLFDGEVLA